MKLPVIAGFIFPNGIRIETAGIGHCKRAREYIQEHNLWKEFNNSHLAEDDFMVEKLGAVKVAMYCGKKYIYVPRLHNWYISQVKNMYKNHGYKVMYLYQGICNNENYICCDSDNCFPPYNQLVVPIIQLDGSVKLEYNPKRIGD